MSFNEALRTFAENRRRIGGGLTRLKIFNAALATFAEYRRRIGGGLTRL
jgi:hypothetical protein